MPRIRFAYDREKAAELAADFVRRAGGSMPMLKLLKLMYLADRTSLIETGFPITGDEIVTMDKGPVLSKTYDLLKPRENSMPFIRSLPGDVELAEPVPEHGRLSDYEIRVAARVFNKWGKMTGAQLSDLLHQAAPEWHPPTVAGSSERIDPEVILRAAGKSDQEIAGLAEEVAYYTSVERRTA